MKGNPLKSFERLFDNGVTDALKRKSSHGSRLVTCPECSQLVSVRAHRIEPHMVVRKKTPEQVAERGLPEPLLCNAVGRNLREDLP